jgi:hypothetical protein
MKECRCISDLYVEVHDDRADAEADRHFRDHISQCGQCREDFRWYGVTVHALNRLDTIAPPPGFLEQLSLRLDNVDSPAYVTFFRNLFSSAPRLPLPVGFASLAAVIFLGFVLYNPSLTGGLSGFWFGPSHGQTASPHTPGTGMLAKDANTGTPLQSSMPSSPISPRYSTPAHFPQTVADRLGADNLTVESPSVETAVESFQRLLPTLQGRVMEVKPRDGVGPVVLRVMIPSTAYADLTSKLIDFGAVEAGAGPEVNPPKPAENGAQNVYLYIRFLPPR